MIDILLTWQFWLVFLPLMFAIWLLQYYTKLRYFKLGAQSGFVLGVNTTIKVLADQRMLTEEPKDTKTVVSKIAPILISNLIQSYNRKAGYES